MSKSSIDIQLSDIKARVERSAYWTLRGGNSSDSGDTKLAIEELSQALIDLIDLIATDMNHEHS